MAFDDGVKTVSGSVAHTDDAAAKVPFVSVKCGIKPTLSGVSSVNEKQIPSRNMASMSDADFTLNSVRYKTENGVLYIDGTSTGETLSVNDAFKALDFWLPSGTYYFSRGATLTSLNVATYLRKYDDKTEIKANKGSFTLSENTHLYISFYVYNKTFSNIKAEICINIGSTAIAYEDTAPITTYTASLGRTIYGGTADIVNGVGTETHVKYSITGQETGYFLAGANNNGNRIGFRISGARTPLYTGGISNIGENKPNLASSSWTIGSWCIYTDNNLYFVVPNEYTTFETALQYLVDNNATFVFPLATQTDFTFAPITPTPETVGKVNNVYCNTGETEVTYHDNAHGFAEVTVNKTGKNLFDISKVATTGTTAGISWSVSGNEITISGTATSSGWKTFVEFKLPHKGTYHFHMNATGNVGYFLRGWTQLVGKDVTEVCNDPSQVYRIAIAVTTAGQTYEGTISEIQIEVGDAYTSYEPYEAVSKTAYLHKVIYGGTADVVKGTCKPKNLLKLYLARTSSLGVNFSLTDEGLLHMEGTNTSSTGSAFSGGNYNTYDDCPWKFPAGTYTASSIVSADLSKIGSLNLLIRTKSDNVQTVYYLKDAPKTFTVNEDFGAWFWASVLKSETVNCDVGVQLEKGSTASEYTPYFDPFSFPPISISTDEGENTLFANEGSSAITYRKETD